MYSERMFRKIIRREALNAKYSSCPFRGNRILQERWNRKASPAFWTKTSGGGNPCYGASFVIVSDFGVRC